jgi:hypothetical protein
MRLRQGSGGLQTCRRAARGERSSAGTRAGTDIVGIHLEDLFLTLLEKMRCPHSKAAKHTSGDRFEPLDFVVAFCAQKS